MIDEHPNNPHPIIQLKQLLVRQPWLAGLLGLLLFAGWALASDWLAPIIAIDIDQHRLSSALPPPGPEVEIRQTFTPEHDGLTAVEIQLVDHDRDDQVGQLQVQLLDPAGRSLFDRTLNNLSLLHNQLYTIQFPPQPHSAGQQHTLVLSGSPDNRFSVWGYELDSHAGGQLTVNGAETNAQELRLVTHYRLTLPIALKRVAGQLWAEGGWLLLALLFITAPGALLLTWLVPRWPFKEWLVWVGVALALGLAVWPLLWLWLSLVGGRWTAVSLSLFTLACWLGTFALRWRRGERLRWRWPQPKPQTILLLLILLVSLGGRFLAVRDQLFPLWVDASRHGLITAVMADSGQTLTTYRPFLPVDRFPYHFGFHTISASLYLLTDLPLNRLLLYLGQWLNGLLPLTAYSALYLWTRRPVAALSAAFLIGLPFFFPAYYATWGRLTQLTALVVMPVALALCWQLIRGGRSWRRQNWLLALLAAGLFLIHVRIFLLFLPFVGLVWLFSNGRSTRPLLAATGLALLLILPRVGQLLSAIEPGRLTSSPSGYNQFPSGYIESGWEAPFLWLGLLVGLWAMVDALRNRRWAITPLLLFAWVGISGLLLTGRRLGLPETWLININSAYIALFLPLAILLASGLARLWQIGQRRMSTQLTLYFLVGLAGGAAFLFGLRQQSTILNPQTILARAPDLAALQWLDEQVPQESTIAANSWLWLGTTWAGSDGGAWIVPLTGRESTIPPADYIYDRALAEQVHLFNQNASQVDSWSDPEATAWLVEQGVDYIFIGARGGFFDPQQLSHNPTTELLYSHDGAFIFQLQP